MRLVIADVPASQIGDVHREVLVPLTNLADGSLTFTLTLDVSSTEGIPESVLETKVKETIRQMGARIVEEEKEEDHSPGCRRPSSTPLILLRQSTLLWAPPDLNTPQSSVRASVVHKT